jgi:hypothetical protein
MENQQQFHAPQVPLGMQAPLPNATTALVLGIISIPTCCCFGIVGLVCGIIAIVLGHRALKLYRSNPSHFNISSYNNANAGFVCGIVGTVFSALCLFYFIYLMIIGAMLNTLSQGFNWEGIR